MFLGAVLRTVRVVASRAAFVRATRRVAQVCKELQDSRALRLAMLDEIRSVVGFDFYAWVLTDPQTLVGCSPLADAPNLADLPRLIRLKYLTPVNRWTALGTSAVASLRRATAGDLSHSLLWRELLANYDVGDVASSVFNDKFGGWGFLDLWRCGDGAAFDDDEMSFLVTINKTVATALRRCQANTFLAQRSVTATRPGPLVLLLSATLDVVAQTPETENVLRVLLPPAQDGTPIPATAYNVGAQLLAVEAEVDQHDPCARMHLAGGLWVTVSAARIEKRDSSTSADIAITIEASSPNDRMLMFGLAFGLSAREREILDHLATGTDTRELAGLAGISVHTVQDHLKSIFAKTAANNRRTLLSRVLGN